MKPLALADCIRSTPTRTLVALTRELSHRARRSLVGERNTGRAATNPAEEEVVPAWLDAVRAISAGRIAPTQH